MLSHTTGPAAVFCSLGIRDPRRQRIVGPDGYLHDDSSTELRKRSNCSIRECVMIGVVSTTPSLGLSGIVQILSCFVGCLARWRRHNTCQLKDESHATDPASSEATPVETCPSSYSLMPSRNRASALNSCGLARAADRPSTELLLCSSSSQTSPRSPLSVRVPGLSIREFD